MILALALLAVAAPAETTLADSVRGRTLPIHTYTDGAALPLSDRDNINNFKNGHKILQLSRMGLTRLDGIASLRVVDGGREMGIAEVKNLHLYLNENELTALPPELFTLQNVIFLYLNYNRLGAIPEGIARMKGLQGVYFTSNGIGEIPPAIFTMTWLRKLQVSKNHLTRLDPAIGNLTQLIHFNISSNQIAELPDSVAKLKLLRVCDFSKNRITRLPEAFGDVPVVHQLRVCDNPISSLPAGFANMPGTIDVTGTKIDVEKLPPQIRAKISREKANTKTDKGARRQRQ